VPAVKECSHQPRKTTRQVRSNLRRPVESRIPYCSNSSANNNYSPSSGITMRSSPFFSRPSFAKLLSLVPLISAQSTPNGVYRNGNGAPGVAPYQLVDDYSPEGFFDKFNFFTAGDPTSGHVQYVDRNVAERNGYVSTTNGAARMSVDTTNKFPLGGPGRPSVRLVSNNGYSHGLFIADVKHMPTGCGTWPAYWLVGPDPWPTFGEIGE
jgi:hypothetical protein